MPHIIQALSWVWAPAAVKNTCPIFDIRGKKCLCLSYLIFAAKNAGVPYSIFAAKNAWPRMVVAHIWHDPIVWDVTNSCVWYIIRYMTHSYVWHMNEWYIICVTYEWVIYRHMLMDTCDMTQLSATWFIHMWHDLFICDMTHSHIRHDDMTDHMWHDSFNCDMTHSHMTWLIHIRDMIDS